MLEGQLSRLIRRHSSTLGVHAEEASQRDLPSHHIS